MREYVLKKAEVRLQMRETPGIYSTGVLNNPAKVRDCLIENMRGLDRENLWVINLDAKCKPINYHVASVGGLDSTMVDVANVFKTAILSNASSILIAHNHPSNDPTPSGYDIEVTKRIAGAGKLLGIELRDHVVVGGASYYSFYENNRDALNG